MIAIPFFYEVGIVPPSFNWKRENLWERKGHHLLR